MHLPLLCTASLLSAGSLLGLHMVSGYMGMRICRFKIDHEKLQRLKQITASAPVILMRI